MSKFNVNDIKQVLVRHNNFKMNYKVVNANEAKKQLEETIAGNPLIIISHTPATNVKLKDVFAIKSRQVSINIPYQTEVNIRRDAVGSPADFEAKPRSWGKHLTTSFIHHSKQLYVAMHVQKTFYEEYFDKFGEPIDIAVIEQHEKPLTNDSRQELDRPVIYRNYKLSNILSFSNKETLTIINHEE